ncbi:MAG: pyridoxal-phosphate dependent enzyme [Pseudomonadota bacterium]
MPPSDTILTVAANAAETRRRIKGAVLQTPCLQSRAQCDADTKLFYKCENFQTTGSFKLRGAMSRLTTLPLDMPVITASSGNHGIACSHAARATGHALTVVLPKTVAKSKRALIESYGTKTILYDGDSGLAERHARALAAEGAYTYVSPYNDPMIVAGQASIGLELLDQLPQIDNVFVSLGGGGLISGIGSVLRAFSPKTRIIGVSATNSAALAESLTVGKVVDTAHLETLADGIAGSMDHDSITFPIASEIVDTSILCSEDEIAAALRHLAWTETMLVEGAAALALAGYLAKADTYAGQCSVVVLCGANFDPDVVRPVVMRDD